MRSMWLRAAFVGTLGLVAGGALGCAEERAPINRVQANALAKSFFVGDNLADDSDNPEFWTQGTVVDVGYGAAQDGLFTSTYAQPVGRLKWQVTEDLLIGRLTYERIQDSDGKMGVGPSTNQGVIVAAYPIDSHFDIRYDYNPSTGEEMNVLVENSTDRTWDKREYFRVDWSKNLNVDSYDFDTLSMLGVYGGVEYESLKYYVNDPNDPDAPHFDPETGYFDITNKAFAKPKMIDLSHLGWGIDKFPACMLDNDFFGGSAPSGTCNPVEITIRQSFRRVVDRDYEPMNWDGKRFSAYGIFYGERSGYARNYGMSDDKWYRFAHRYNIWERSHYYEDPVKMTGAVECFVPDRESGEVKDPHLDADGNGTEDACEAVTQKTGVAGSRCDEFKQKCTLPYRLRKEVPQAWYYTETSDSEYFDGSSWATNEWDVAMRGAVMTSRNAECKATGGDPTGCDGQFPMYHGQMDDNWDLVQLSKEVDACRAGKAYGGKNCEGVADQVGAERQYDPAVIALAKQPEMVVLCHSPVIESDSPTCGPLGRSVRMGDLRYHQINVIHSPQTPSPWGIMTDSNDPLTGEKIAASVNVWAFVNDLWSQGIVDQMRYLTGELKTEDVTEGTYVKDWAIAEQAAGGTGILPPVTRAELDRQILGGAGVMPNKMKDVGSFDALLAQPGMAQKLDHMRQTAMSIRSDATAASTLRPIYEARRHGAMGSAMEAELTTTAMQQLAGTDKLPAGAASVDFASPLRGNNLRVQSEFRRAKELAIADRGGCIMEASFPSPVSLSALNRVVEEKFKDVTNPHTGKPYGVFNDPNANTKQDQLDRAEVIRKFLAQRAHYAVIAHEMGHSIGLRHNFVSSSDAWGYRPQYWQLRTKNGKVSTACTDLKTPAESENCVGPRYFDQVTTNERDNLINMFMHQSIMDYAGEATQDLVGLGAYDFAAARMFYGQSVAVHLDDDMKSNKPLGKAALDKMDGFGGIVGYQYTSNGSANIHYSQLQKNWRLIDPASCISLTEDQVQRRRPVDWNEGRDGKWDPLLDGLIVKVNNEYSICKQRKVDYVPWQQMTTTGADFNTRYSSIDSQARTRVPYGFATDRWADLGNVAVFRHDNGADVYELFNFLITQPEVGHIFDNYRRNRQGFSIRSSATRTLSRYNEKMRDAAKGLGLLANIYKDFALDVGYDYKVLWPIIAQQTYADNILASGMAFDHFAREVARPQAGEHYKGTDGILHPNSTLYSSPPPTALVVPNGATGFRADNSPLGPASIGIGGRWLENRLADNKGNDYDSEYTINCGSYYDKAYASMLMTESVDNFISASTPDFVDARYRAVALADVFPEGYRRWLANNLTGDEALKGSWVKTVAGGNPDVDSQKFPKTAIGWTNWWHEEGPQVCFAGEGTNVCSAFGWPSDTVFEQDPVTLDNLIPIEPLVGWEQQKFLIAWTMNYLPENQQQWWINMLRLWELGADGDPGFDNRIEFHDPAGKVYVAKRFGTEVLFPGSKYAKTVEKGVGARVMQYANDLLQQAYEVDAVDNDNDGKTDWYVAKINPTTGEPLVKFDPSINNSGLPFNAECTALDNSGCTCTANRACVKLSRYVELPFFMRQALAAYGLGDPTMKGIYN